MQRIPLTVSLNSCFVHGRCLQLGEYAGRWREELQRGVPLALETRLKKCEYPCANDNWHRGWPWMMCISAAANGFCNSSKRVPNSDMSLSLDPNSALALHCFAHGCTMVSYQCQCCHHNRGLSSDSKHDSYLISTKT